MTHPHPLQLRLPVFAAPMFLISGPEMVLSACKAGIVGAFPTPNARPIEKLETWMQNITEGLAEARETQAPNTLGPWCANLVTHSSNTRLAQDLELIARFKPPVVVTALGSPKPAIEVVQAYGGRVYADVINLTLAQKAVKAGADGLACVCAGAGGHTGFLSPFAFVSAIREFFDGEIILGGGICDGAGIAGAIAAGADYVYMGTRFIPAHESMAPPAYKDMVLNSNIDDLIISAGVTGTPASWLKPSLKMNGLDPDNMPEAPTRHYDSSTEFSGKKWLDVWASGQGLGTIRTRQSVGEIVNQLASEFENAMHRLQTLPYATRSFT